jgi:2-dehydro-3-deoxygluconokinase
MDVITLGETMIALTPTQTGSLEGVSTFDKRMAGAESNVAIGLSRLGHEVAWVSRLGDDGFGRFIYKTLRGEGVDVSMTSFDAKAPTGVYFKELDAYGHAKSFYYRSGSAASFMSLDSIHRERIQRAAYLFITGITPALSDTCRETVLTAIDSANETGVKVVFDPNVRLKLWTLAEAVPVLRAIAAKSEILLPGLDEGRMLTGGETPEQIAQVFLESPVTNLVVIKLGQTGAYFATRDTGGYVDGFVVNQVDETGAGDAFDAGVISGLLDELPVMEAVLRGCAMGALAVTAKGDYESLPTRGELSNFIHGVETAKR